MSDIALHNKPVSNKPQFISLKSNTCVLSSEGNDQIRNAQGQRSSISTSSDKFDQPPLISSSDHNSSPNSNPTFSLPVEGAIDYVSSNSHESPNVQQIPDVC